MSIVKSDPRYNRYNLTEYAVATRYPGDIEEITLAEAGKAVRLARKVRKAVRGLLPKEALTTKRKQSR